MTDFINKIFDFLKENKEPKSPFYKVFFISYFICNWKGLYLLFIQDGDIFLETTKLSKFEYFINHYSLHNGFNFNWENVIFTFLCPLLLTFSVFYIFPFITNIILDKSNKNRESENLINQKAKLEKLDNTELIIDKEKKLVESQSDLWDKEYEGFKKDILLYEKFSEIIIRIYNYGGRLGYLEEGNKYLPEISSYIITRFNILEIIVKSKNSNNYFLTDKGEYFSKKYEKEKAFRNVKFINLPEKSIDFGDIPF